MGSKKKPKVHPGISPAVMSMVLISGNPDGSFGFEIESELSAEALEEILRAAADEVGGKVDRAAGAWGRR